MTEEEALAVCRYYKGEEKFPDSMEKDFWYFWIAEDGFMRDWEGEDKYMKEFEDRLVGYRQDDGVPLRLKAFVYLVIRKHCSSLNDDDFDVLFKNDAYLRYYYGLTRSQDLNISTVKM